MYKANKNDDYIFEIFHDLKAPILSINIALENIERDDFLDEIYKINKHNLNYIENMLTGYSIFKEKYCPNFEKVNILKIVKEEINVLKFLAAEKNLFFEIITEDKNDFFALTDKCIIRQIILNLLTNAVKYTPINSTVRISFFKKREKLNICFSNPYDKKLSSQCSSRMGLEIIKKKIKILKGKLKITNKDKEICFNLYLSSNLCDNQG